MMTKMMTCYVKRLITLASTKYSVFYIHQKYTETVIIFCIFNFDIVVLLFICRELPQRSDGGLKERGG